MTLAGSIPSSRFSRKIGPALTIGFGTTVAMGAIGYICRMPGVSVPPWLLLGLFLLCPFLGGWFAARYGGQNVRGGLYGGLVAGLVNLLILGSLLSGAKPGQIVPSALWWIPGSLLLAMLLVAAGTAAGRAVRPPAQFATTETVNWRAGFATVTVGVTLILLLLGGIVTGYEAGMAVPDWPNSYGYNMFLYPLARMTGGIYYEHAHRLFGSLAGLTTLTLAVYLLVDEKRGWLKLLGLLALAVVSVQGYLGGMRVTESNISLAIVHGVLAQLFFSLLVVPIRVFTSTTWQTARPPISSTVAGMDRKLCLLLTAALVVQLILGALQRHLSWGLHLHITMAVVVLLLALATGYRAWGFYDNTPLISRLGAALLWLVIIQLALGIGAFVVTGLRTADQPPTGLEVVVTTAHQTTGALLLACSMALTLWNYRLAKPAVMEAGEPAPAAG